MKSSRRKIWVSALVSGALALSTILGGASAGAATELEEDQTRLISGKVALPQGLGDSLISRLHVRLYAEGARPGSLPIAGPIALRSWVQPDLGDERTPIQLDDDGPEVGAYAFSGLAPARYIVELSEEGLDHNKPIGPSFGGGDKTTQTVTVDVTLLNRVDVNFEVGDNLFRVVTSGSGDGTNSAIELPRVADPQEVDDPSALPQTAVEGNSAELGYSISGTISLPEGSPKSWFTDQYISVQAERIVEGHYFDGDPYPGKIDGSGHFVIGNVPPGDYRVLFLANGEADSLVSQYWDNTSNFRDVKLVELVEADVSNINASLKKGSNIRGQVDLANGVPSAWLGCIEVSASGVNGFKTAQVNMTTGEYEIRGLSDDDYLVQFAGRPWGEDCVGADSLITQFWKNAYSYDRSTRLRIDSNDHANVDAIISTGFSLSGKIILPSGADASWLSKISLSAIGENTGFMGWSQLDVDGNYHFRGLPKDNYRLSLTVQQAPGEGSINLANQYYGGTFEYNEAVPLIVNSDLSNIEFKPKLGLKISGKVTIPVGGEPEWLTSIQVSVNTINGTEHTYKTALVQGDGTYVIQGLSPGAYRVKFDPRWGSANINLAPQYWKNAASFRESENVILADRADGSAENVNADLQLGRTISGKMTLPEDVEVNDFRGYYVWAFNAYGHGGSGEVDSQGNYKIIGLSSSTFTVGFGAPRETNLISGYYNGVSVREDATPVDVRDGDESEVNHTFLPGSRILGKIPAYPKQGNGWVAVTSLDGTTELGGSSVQQDGTFEIGHLAVGQVRLLLCEHIGESGDVPGIDPSSRCQFLSEGNSHSWEIASTGDKTVNPSMLAADAVNASISGALEVRGKAPAFSYEVALIHQKIGKEWVVLERASRNFATTNFVSPLMPAGEYLVSFEEREGTDSSSDKSVKIHEWFDRKTTRASATIIELGANSLRTGVDGTVNYDPVVPVIVAGDVKITGGDQVGQTLTAVPGDWVPSGVQFAYQWKVAGANIPGATTVTYVPVASDAGKKVTVTVTGSLSGGALPVSKTSPAVDITAKPVVPVIVAGDVKITGGDQVGQTLTAVPGDWVPSGVQFAYQWKVAGANIPGATSVTYVPVASDAGKKVTVTVTGSLSGGALPVSKTSPAVAIRVKDTYVPPKPVRLAGNDRFQTAVKISQDGFPNPSAVDTVVLADGYGFADALAAAPLAAKLGAPLLLTQASVLTASTKEELDRLRPSKVIIIGGLPTIHKSVELELAKSYQVERIAGTDRFDTSLKIAERGWPMGSSRAFMATGHNFPDALAAGAAASSQDIPVVLVWGPNSTMPEGMLERLRALKIAKTYIAGSNSTVSSGIETQLRGAQMAPKRFAGADRVDTSVLIAEEFGTDGDSMYVAFGWNFPDALAGAVVAGRANSSLVLSEQPCMSHRLRSVVDKGQPGRVVLLGGVPSLGTGVAEYTYCGG